MANRGLTRYVGILPVITCCAACLAVGLAGCDGTSAKSVRSADHGTTQRAHAVASARLAQDENEESRSTDRAPADVVGPDTMDPAPDVEELKLELPSPEAARGVAREMIEEARATIAEARQSIAEAERESDAEIKEQKKKEAEGKIAEAEGRIREMERFLARLDRLDRPQVVRLTLDEVIQRTIENNYAIKIQTYNPAIEATRIVEAESAFDAVYFANATYNRQDRPSASTLIGTQSDVRNLETGVRKLLSTGATMQASYALNRQSTNLVFQTLNPSYFNQFIVELRQPFLRGFGLDFNRSRIELARLDESTSRERMRREIREVIYNVEQAYWRVDQLRRDVVVGSRLLTNLETILNWLSERERLGFDVYPVQLRQTESRIELNRADFIRTVNQLFNAETALKSLMNDPELNLSVEVEIIPATLPAIEPIVIDQLGEITTALSHRAELHEAKLAIEKAELAIGVAKNQALPSLDLLFRYIVDGLGGNTDQAFSQLSGNDFHEYLVTLQFEWPIGNRGPEAAVRRARLQQAQAIMAHRAAIESVIREVKVAIRDLKTAYDQITPTLKASQASQDQLRATVERMIRRDPASLQVELDAHQTLAASRRQLLQAVIDYNIARANLERQKGTLLEYNNIVIKDLEDFVDRPIDYLAP